MNLILELEKTEQNHTIIYFLENQMQSVPYREGTSLGVQERTNKQQIAPLIYQNWKQKEAKLFFQHQTADLVESYSIPPSLIMNFDQTTLKYTPFANQTLKKVSKRVCYKKVLV